MTENSKYAIITAGGKQHRVSEGLTIWIEREDLNPGDEITFEKVIAYNDGNKIQIGTPLVEGAKVSGKVLEFKKQKKVIAFKHKRRKNHRKKIGHRQELMSVEINSIQA